MSLLVVNGVLQQNSPATGAEVLKQFGRGPYTAFLARDKEFTISCWDLHCRRLAHSLRRILSSLEGTCNATSALNDADTAQERQNLVVVLLPTKPQPPQAQTGKVALEDMVDVVVHMVPVTQPLDGPVSVAVSGPGREMPDAKDSQWARDRQVLEAQLPAGASEGLLCTADGAVLESFVSNFFVVREGNDGYREVQTAAPTEGLLEGIMRWQVLQACKEVGLRVVTCAPLLKERVLWTEAFLTNSVCGIRPVERIICRRAEGGGHWEAAFPAKKGEITQQLQAALGAIQQRPPENCYGHCW
ncbi:hypothetical protein WJX75_009988 [Coccomyxa subellipsoidea]|uniref:D-aminoacid aminotransferase-like PLP-dependent enzyme n=1 Tax=Coccomyxa subellipsoidea TaxID=248742 RepID=A0ABR2YSP0_9CHLO